MTRVNQNENDNTSVEQIVTDSNDTMVFVCEPGGVYSLSMQKQTQSGNLILTVMKNFQVLKRGETDADYGLVSLTGHCP